MAKETAAEVTEEVAAPITDTTDADKAPAEGGEAPKGPLLAYVRSAFNKFTGMVVALLAGQAGMTDAQIRGFRNLLRSAVRDGGKKTKGYYEALPTGDGEKVFVPDHETDDGKNIPNAQETAITAVRALVAALIPARTVKANYVSEKKTFTVNVPTDKLSVPSEDALMEMMDAAFAAPFSSQEGLAEIDF
jgi:hypothetical protein